MGPRFLRKLADSGAHTEQHRDSLIHGPPNLGAERSLVRGGSRPWQVRARWTFGALAVSRPRDALARARAVLAGRPGPMTPRSPTRPPGSCCATHGDLEAGVRERARRCARPAAPARPSARPTCWPPWASRSSTRAAPPPGWPRSTGAVRGRAGVLAARVLHRRGDVCGPGPVPGGPGRPAARGRRAAARGRHGLDGSRADRPGRASIWARAPRPRRRRLRRAPSGCSPTTARNSKRRSGAQPRRWPPSRRGDLPAR